MISFFAAVFVEEDDSPYQSFPLPEFSAAEQAFARFVFFRLPSVKINIE
jgi:hypothetical protein